MPDRKTGRVADSEPHQLRLFYSLRDIQIALSAFDFLLEVDPEASYSRVELRRFRCFLDAGVIAYCRPFTATQGVPTLSFRQVSLRPTLAQADLHERLKEYRNKVVAHSDADRMRIAVSAETPFEDRDIQLPIMVWDEGLPFLDERDEIIIWLRELRHALSAATFELVQAAPRPYELRKDYLDLDET